MRLIPFNVYPIPGCIEVFNLTTGRLLIEGEADYDDPALPAEVASIIAIRSIPNVDSTPLYVVLAMDMGGTTNAPQCASLEVQIIP